MALIAAVVPFRHMHELCLRHGEDHLAAVLIPLAVDGGGTRPPSTGRGSRSRSVPVLGGIRCLPANDKSCDPVRTVPSVSGRRDLVAVPSGLGDDETASERNRRRAGRFSDAQAG
ncbi:MULTISPECIES: DUF2637 domain-containing protein [unclassified Microbispora]|uniref:DUF2637 domain-containing protein n=1 Tax=unclassified Microbispora TaxID=2614687 RepID=UPI001600C087|nr:MULTISPECIES: DUF2637 domain-containing protein [unclassified Microbispora]